MLNSIEKFKVAILHLNRNWNHCYLCNGFLQIWQYNWKPLHTDIEPACRSFFSMFRQTWTMTTVNLTKRLEELEEWQAVVNTNIDSFFLIVMACIIYCKWIYIQLANLPYRREIMHLIASICSFFCALLLSSLNDLKRKITITYSSLVCVSGTRGFMQIILNIQLILLGFKWYRGSFVLI